MLVHKASHLAIAKALEALLLLQPREERKRVLAVDVRLVHLRERGVVMQGAELVHVVIRTRGLGTKLVAGDVQNLEALVMQLLIERLDRGIVRRESAAGGGVYHQHDLALQIGGLDLVALAIQKREIVKAHALLLSFRRKRYRCDTVTVLCRRLFSWPLGVPSTQKPRLPRWRRRLPP